MNSTIKLALAAAMLIAAPISSSAQTITTIAGNGSSAYSGDGLAATAAGIDVMDVKMDHAGNLYISDRSNRRIRKVNTSGIISTYAGTTPGGYGGDGGQATAAQLNILNGIGIDKYGRIFIADGPNNRIRKVDTSGIITTITGTGFSGFSGEGTPATGAQVSDAYGVATDTMGNVYIADSYNNRIRRIDTGGIITTIAGDGTVGFSGDGLAATAAQLSWPTSIVADNAGNIYFTDNENNRVRKINSAGIISTIAGSGTTGTSPGGYTGSYTGDGGLATAATLNSPAYLALDCCNGLYVADNGNHCIRKINLATGYITTIAGNGTNGFFGDSGPATAAHFSFPYGITLDAMGNLYIADAGNSRVRKVTHVFVPTSLPRATTQPQTEIYPNPINDELLVDNAAIGSAITLYSIVGREVFKGVVNAPNERIDTRHLVPGTYILRLTDASGHRIAKTITKQ